MRREQLTTLQKKQTGKKRPRLEPRQAGEAAVPVRDKADELAEKEKAIAATPAAQVLQVHGTDPSDPAEEGNSAQKKAVTTAIAGT